MNFYLYYFILKSQEICTRVTYVVVIIKDYKNVFIVIVYMLYFCEICFERYFFEEKSLIISEY